MKKLFLLSLLLVSCSGVNHKQVRLAIDWSFNTNHIGILVAQAKGYYTQQGVDLELIPLGKTSSTTLLINQQVDLALSSQGEFTFARDTGAPIISIAALFQHNPHGFYSLKKAHILKPADLQDKIYGGWGSLMEDAVISALMAHDSIKKPKFENKMIGSMNIESALNSVDFIWGFKGWQGAQLDVHHIEYNFLPSALYINALDDYAPIVLANTKSSFYKEHTEEIKSFLKATQQGYIWAMENPKEAVDILFNKDETLNLEVLQRSLKILSPYILSTNGQWGIQDAKRYQAYLDFVKKEHLINQDLKPTDIMTNKFLVQ